MGRQIKETKLEPGNLNIIDLQNLEQGIYIITLLDGTVNHSEKLLLK